MFSIALANRGYCFEDDPPDCDDSVDLAPFLTGLAMATGGVAVALAAMFRDKQLPPYSAVRAFCAGRIATMKTANSSVAMTACVPVPRERRKASRPGTSDSEWVSHVPRAGV